MRWRRPTATLGALAALLAPAAASAAPGLSAPVLVARGVSCYGLAGDTIAWEESKPSKLEEPPAAARIAVLGPQGPESTTTAPPPGPATLFCDPAASAASGAEVYALPAGPHPRSLPVRAAPLWLARPGAPAAPLGVSGIEPTVALAPDGSGVVAWLAEAGLQPLPEYEAGERRTGPGFVVRAARLRPDGQIGPAQTLGAPSAAYEEIPEDAFPAGPVARVMPDGTLAVAWALLGSGSRSVVVQVSEATPGAGFGAPATLLAPSTPPREGLPEEQLDLATLGGGLLAEWQIGGEHLIESATQAAPAASFAAMPQLPSLGNEASELTAIAGDAAGTSLTLLRAPGGSAQRHAALAVVRRQPGGGQRLETLVPAGRHGVTVEGASLAMAADGRAAVAWLQSETARDGSKIARAMLALSPPGGGFEAPAPITGLAQLVGQVSVSFDAAGLLHVAWTQPPEILSAPLYAAVAVPGAPDLVSGPGPKVVLRVRSRRGSRAEAAVTVRVDRPCLIRVQAFPDPYRAPSSLAGGFLRWGVSRDVAKAGLVRIRVPLPEQRLRSARIVAFASTAAGASSKATVVLHLPGRPR